MNATKAPLGVLLTVALFSVTALAGCMIGGGSKDANAAPEAKLATSKDVAWTKETVGFDARQSKDSDGEIVRWTFDFGDGTRYEATREEDAQTSHSYLHGGEYTVTLTVTDDGGENAGVLTATAEERLPINERMMLDPAIVAATPTNQTPTTHSVPIEVYKGADNFEVSLNLQGATLAGSSEIEAKVIDPDGTVLERKTVTISSGGLKSLELDGELSEEGVHKLEITAKSGGATVKDNSELRVYYDRGFLQ